MLSLILSTIVFSIVTFANSSNFPTPGDEPHAPPGSTSSPAIDALQVQEIIIEENPIKAGDTVELKLKIKIQSGFHAYVDQYKFEIESPKEFSLGEFQVRPQVQFTDPITKKIKLGTEGDVEMVSHLDVPANKLSGTYHLNLNLTYQACAKDFCLLPKVLYLKKDIQILGVAQANPLLSALEKGWLYALFIVFLAGLFTSFTPCIFPMIPITLAVLGTTTQRSRKSRFIVSTIYVLGIAVTYSTLGFVAARTGALFGSLLGHPIMVGFISLLFITMGLSMYGLFDIQMPKFITQRLTHHSQNKNLMSAFFSGLLAGVVASPCVGPVLISILAYVAQTQNALKGFILLFTFALGLGQIFIVLGTFNSILHKLPRSGPWMEKVKFLFGSIMIGMALYYIYPVRNNSLLTGFFSVIFILTSIYFYIFQWRRKSHSNPNQLMTSTFFLLFTFGVLLGAKSVAPKFMQEKIFTKYLTDTSKPHINWRNYSDELLAAAKAKKQPVIIDFKAEWCLACKELELYTFSDPRIIELGKQFLWIAFDATSPSTELDILQKKYGIGGLPFVLFYNSRGEYDEALTLTGFEDADKFLQRMQSAIR